MAANQIRASSSVAIASRSRARWAVRSTERSSAPNLASPVRPGRPARRGPRAGGVPTVRYREDRRSAAVRIASASEMRSTTRAPPSNRGPRGKAPQPIRTPLARPRLRGRAPLATLARRRLDRSLARRNPHNAAALDVSEESSAPGGALATGRAKRRHHAVAAPLAPPPPTGCGRGQGRVVFVPREASILLLARVLGRPRDNSGVVIADECPLDRRPGHRPLDGRAWAASRRPRQSSFPSSQRCQSVKVTPASRFTEGDASRDSLPRRAYRLSRLRGWGNTGAFGLGDGRDETIVILAPQSALDRSCRVARYQW